MGVWSPPAGQSILSDVMGMHITTNTFGVVAVAGTSHTKSASWQELIASTVRDAYGIFIVLHSTAGANSETTGLLDIAIGGSGSEQMLIPNLACGWQQEFAVTVGGASYYFPLYIPAGSRLSAKNQSSVTNQNVRVSIWLIGGNRAPNGFVGHRVKDYGTNLAASRGVVSTVASANTFGTGVALSTSTDYPIRYMQVGIQGGGDFSTGTSRMLFRLQPVASSPTSFYVGNPLPFQLNTTVESAAYMVANQILSMMAFDIPAGSPLYVSHSQQNITSATVADFIIYGVD